MENSLDFRWPFGKATWKIVSTVTSMNMYASVFFLTSTSVARYHSVALAPKSHRTRGHGGGDCCGRSLGDSCRFSAKALRVLICAGLAAQSHLLHHDQGDARGVVPGALPGQVARPRQAVLAGPLPLAEGAAGLLAAAGHHQPVLSAAGALHLRPPRAGTEVGASAAGGGLARASARRRSKATKSVTVVVLSFFLCWLPNQALTTWNILIKFNAVSFSREYFLCQVYALRVSVCLAHSNSCLKPILYCLVRREFRNALENLLRRLASPSLTSNAPFLRRHQVGARGPDRQALAPLHQAAEPDMLYSPPGVVVYSEGHYDLLPSSSAY